METQDFQASSDPTEKPILLYDGECVFCCRWIERWRVMTGEKVLYFPYQEKGSEYPEIPASAFQKSVKLIEPGRKITSAAEAVFRTLTYSSGGGWGLWLYSKIPGVNQITEWFYQLVANHRVIFSQLTKLFWGTELKPPTYTFSAWSFLRFLAVIYFFAFVSLGTQVVGLIGENGITPVADVLPKIAERYGWARFWLLPSLVWLNASDLFLQLLCWGGAALSVLLFVGVWPVPLLCLLWFFYLSLQAAGQVFFSFQWDILLLEVGFLAIFLAPLTSRLKLEFMQNPSKPILWLYRWLLFRFIFASGISKLLSHDISWGRWTAMEYHYETQPLPTALGWFVHQLPTWFHKFSVVAVFGLEIIVPFLLFFPRRVRHLAATLLIAFQLLIMATGNYCFFNLLTIGLCLLMFDDAAWPIVLKEKLILQMKKGARSFHGVWPKAVQISVASILFFLSLVTFSRGLNMSIPWPSPVIALGRFVQPFHLVNNYGLFSVMTTERLEIILEGSNDGQTWLPYEFKYKPGDVKRMPGWVIPHQPRLDWQMWFAALGTYRENPWLINLCARLLENSQPVLNLLKTNPFSPSAPRYVRAAAYKYHFTSPDEIKQTGNWWKREREGLYMQTVFLDEDDQKIGQS